MKVQVYIYDLSMGLAAQLSPLLLGKQINGIWHTGIVVFGKEYFFGGQGIEHCAPGGTVMGNPHKVHDLGETEIPMDVFKDYLSNLADKFNSSTYDLFMNNCNSFSNEIAQFLTGQTIPDYIVNLPKEVLATPFGSQLRPFLQQMQDGILPTTVQQPQASSSSGTSNNDAQSSKNAPQQTGRTDFPESDISKIVQSGFTRSEAIEELDEFSGDTDKALASLFAKALQFQ